MIEALETRLARLRSEIGQCAPLIMEGAPAFVLFFSCSDGKSRATVLTASGATAEEAWDRGAHLIAESGVPLRWLRVDWVDAAEQRTWKGLRAELAKIKRNYFRLGIALDAGFECAFLETELNANAMLYGGPREALAVLNERNFSIYAAKRHGLSNVSFADNSPVWLFTTRGAFIGDDMQVHRLDGAGLDAGRRSIRQLDAADALGLIRSGSGYLASQVQADGRFHYGWHPCFDRPIDTYNSLRHASSLYSMIEAWEVTRDDVLKQAIDRALHYLVNTLIRSAPLPSGGEGAFLVDQRSEIKLGGNAVAILALVKYTEITGDQHYLSLLEKLASGILFMQDADTGSFQHVLNYPALDLKEVFRTIYYDGEAAFGLMRLYGLTREPRWLAAVEKAFEHFIEQEHWKHHDHWLSYCVNELTIYRPDERYFRFGLDNVRGYLGFVLERITTFPTLLELMMAAERMIERLRAEPAMRHLLDAIDLPRFYKALHFRAHHLLNGHFWPELAMFYANPAKITGSFFIRHHAFRVRIDDVEHYLSGFVAYRRYLLAREAQREHSEPVAKVGETARHWRALHVAQATGGRWHTPPASDWSASGLCKSAPTMREGDIVAVRLAEGEVGVSQLHLNRLKYPPAAILASDPAKVASVGAPVLVVENVSAAILALGKYARDRLAGKLVGVTGSAGKTTAVAMLSHALAPFGAVGQTRHNANLPHGIAWNLASIPWDTPHTVLELAIGRMAQNARMTRPDVAIFTNVLPAHLEYHRDLGTVADRKSAIFGGMTQGSTAILNRDMAEWGRVQMAARSRGLRVVNYGKSPDCDVQLLSYDPVTRRVTARFGERELCYPLGAGGEHMALNSLAVLAAVSALELDLEPAIARLMDFAAVAGRGQELQLILGDGLSLTVIDEAYNANPGSMDAALALLGAKRSAERRIAVLGEMLELGEDASAYHTRLAPLIELHDIDRVYALGDLYDDFWNEVPENRRAVRPESIDELKHVLGKELRAGDVLLLKGSHGTRIHEVVSWLKVGASIGDILAHDVR